MELITVGYAIVAAIIYALFGYLKTAPSGEEFSGTKFMATLVIGAIIGIVFAFTGIPVTQEAVQIQIVAYAGLTAIVENVLKSIWRFFNPQA